MRRKRLVFFEEHCCTPRWFIYSSYDLCYPLNLYSSLCFVRRMVRALQHGSLTAATGSQRECTPWLWSQLSLQMASLSYLHRCSKRREPQNSDLITLIPNTQISATFTVYENKCNRSLYEHTGINRNNFRLLLSQKHSACAKTHICSVPGTVLIFPAL